MTRQTQIQLAVGLVITALGALLAFTAHNDTLRLAGAAAAALGLVVARRALRGVKWRK